MEQERKTEWGALLFLPLLEWELSIVTLALIPGPICATLDQDGLIARKSSLQAVATLEGWLVVLVLRSGNGRTPEGLRPTCYC